MNKHGPNHKHNIQTTRHPKMPQMWKSQKSVTMYLPKMRLQRMRMVMGTEQHSSEPKHAISLNPTREIENKPAERFCCLCILSHYIQHKEDKSVSGNLVGQPELDKTRTLKKFYKIKGVTIETDLTYIGIIMQLEMRY